MPDVVDLLRRGQVTLEPGLDEAELLGIEHEFGFRFSPPHEAVLRQVLPVESDEARRRDDGAWPDWRGTPRVLMHQRLAVPEECVLDCVESHAMWLSQLWGPRPPELATAVSVVHDFLTEAPCLVPVNGHRWLPEDCGVDDPAVISLSEVAPFDPIFIGTTLTDYLADELGLMGRTGYAATRAGPVPFWSDFIAWAEDHWSDPTCPANRSG